MKRILVEKIHQQEGQEVRLCGWVNSIRAHGKLIFVDLRDRSGVAQIVFNPQVKRETYLMAKKLTPESCIEVTGKVNLRPEGLQNEKIISGNVEIEISKLEIFSLSKPLPFPLDTDGLDIDEEVRLKYRYLDLRRERLAKNIRLRSQLIQLVREYLFKQDFCEIETPLLTKSTPEGSRDFIVPSRLQKGKFYALPQSPQQYKQLLMVAGFEKYFQIAKCLRDEDLRAHRGFEFTQVDLEMSFVKREDVMALIESLTIFVVEELGGKIVKKPFPVFTYEEAIKKYGADKFDIRSADEKEKGMHGFAWVVDFPFFKKDQDGSWTFTHNPFSDPIPEHKEAFLNGEIKRIITTQYDLVWNGYEAGGGSIRSTDPKILSRVFEILGHSPEKIQQQFGHMLEAFSFGVPPHGGIALGIDRWLMILRNEKYIREAQAFPMTAKGRTAVMDAPSEVSDQQLEELDIKIVGQGSNNLLEKIKELLGFKKIEYKLLEHEAVFTSEQAAKVRGTKLSQSAKAMVCLIDGKPGMIVVPGDRKIDFKKFKESQNAKSVKFAESPEVRKLTGVEIGAVPPFGNLLNLKLYVDENLAKEKEIAFNAGSHTVSIVMKYKDYMLLCSPIVGDFSS